jgi:hypothetical protein
MSYHLGQSALKCCITVTTIRSDKQLLSSITSAKQWLPAISVLHIPMPLFSYSYSLASLLLRAGVVVLAIGSITTPITFTLLGAVIGKS